MRGWCVGGCIGGCGRCDVVGMMYRGGVDMW